MRVGRIKLYRAKYITLIASRTQALNLTYNTQLLLLLATVDRLFNYATMTNLPKSNKLSEFRDTCFYDSKFTFFKQN